MSLLTRAGRVCSSAPSQTRRATRPRELPIAPLPSENVAGPSVPRGAMPPPPPATEAHHASRPAAGPPSPRRDVASPRPEIASPSPRPDATPVMPPRFRTGVGRSRSATHDSPVPQANAGLFFLNDIRNTSLTDIQVRSHKPSFPPVTPRMSHIQHRHRSATGPCRRTQHARTSGVRTSKRVYFLFHFSPRGILPTQVCARRCVGRDRRTVIPARRCIAL